MRKEKSRAHFSSAWLGRRGRREVRNCCFESLGKSAVCCLGGGDSYLNLQILIPSLPADFKRFSKWVPGKENFQSFRLRDRSDCCLGNAGWLTWAFFFFFLNWNSNSSESAWQWQSCLGFSLGIWHLVPLFVDKMHWSIKLKEESCSL